MKHMSKIKTIVEVLMVLLLLYIIAVYSNLPFISKWRTIYIETAMSTMTHQWLATAFIPSDVVNKVVTDMQTQQEENLVDSNQIEPDGATIWLGHPMGLSPEQVAYKEFLEEYDEIDLETMPEGMEYLNLVLEGEKTAGIKTVYGDSVYAIDTINGVVIVNIVGDGYNGKLAIIKDPSKVKLASSSSSSVGEHVADIAVANNAVVAINASGFYDPNGVGNGSQPVGLVKQQGKLIQEPINYGYWFKVGFDNSNNLRIGTAVDVESLRDGVQFKPALVIDGEKKVSGSAGWGIQPRSVIGQSADKQVFMLVVDGRQPTHSIGITVGECADILIKYGATQAINLDGGSSSALVYKGTTITKPSTSGGNKDGRRIPNAWIVESSQVEEN